MRFRSLVAVLLGMLALAGSAQAAPQPVDGFGITVGSVTPATTARLQPGMPAPASTMYDIKLSSAAISASPKVTAIGNGVRIELPPNYETSGKHYPVLYLLHGTGGLSYKAWTETMPTQSIVGNREVILVMVDGGKNGWYSDWEDQSQKWETFHLKQLVPWVDANFRTIATREGRGISGFSMGGFGAMHYAADRPDLFGAVASISGAVDLQDPLIGGISVPTANVMFQLNPFGAFGFPLLGLDGRINSISGAYARNNPMNYLANLRNTKILMSSAFALNLDMTNPLGSIAGTPIEAGVTSASTHMHTALDRLKIPNTFINFGAPGKFAYGNCQGGHVPDCMSYQFNWALPQLLAALRPAA